MNKVEDFQLFVRDMQHEFPTHRLVFWAADTTCEIIVADPSPPDDIPDWKWGVQLIKSNCLSETVWTNRQSIRDHRFVIIARIVRALNQSWEARHTAAAAPPSTAQIEADQQTLADYRKAAGLLGPAGGAMPENVAAAVQRLREAGIDF